MNTNLDIQELETRLADLPELERRRLIDRAIRMRQVEMRCLADAGRREGIALDNRPCSVAVNDPLISSGKESS